MNKVIYINDENINFDIKENETLEIYHYILDKNVSVNIVIEMGYATDLHREALIATGVVLFVFILIINLCVSALKRRAEDE